MVGNGSQHPAVAVDLDMLDSSSAERRPSLSTSLSDFALFPTSSAPSSPSSITPEDSLSPFFRRLRRSSLLASNPITADADSKPSSPLATSFTPRFNFDAPEKMAADDSTSAATPPLLFAAGPSTPPRATPSLSTSPRPTSPNARRRPPKPARLLDLRSELRSPIESELKSEAQFQRLIASYSYTGFPPSKHLPRTPRAWADRGRYPEEAGGDEDSQGGESASDEGEQDSASASASASASVSASVNMTPSGSGSGEDQAMTIDTAIVGTFMMDVDVPSAVNSPVQWRQTPPPTASGVRTNKRKFDDRYDPYPSAVKRRAVSPSVHAHHTHAHHSHAHHSHAHPHAHHHPRSGSISHVSPISIPVPRAARSVTSSPVLRPTSSPVMRPMSFPGHSPVLKGASPTIRPIARLTLGERERERSQRGVDGAGEAVGSLSIA